MLHVGGRDNHRPLVYPEGMDCWCDVWGCWEVTCEGPGTVWEDFDCGWDDPEGLDLEGCDDEEFEDL